MKMVQAVYNNATSVMDMAPCRIIEARVYAGQGDSQKALDCLKVALSAMGVSIPEATIEECDAQLEELLPYLRSLAESPLSQDTYIQPHLDALGITLVE